MEQERFYLDLVPGSVPQIIHVSQFDTDRMWVFTPVYREKLYEKHAGSTAVIEATKPDNTVVLHDLIYNDDGTITVDLSQMEQLTTVAGDVRAKIRIVSSVSTTLASAEITIAVDIAGYDTNAQVSESDLEAIRSAITNSSQIADNMETSEKYAQSAQNSATMAESYAHGGTGKREGEDTDNAKQYAQDASDSNTAAGKNKDAAKAWAVGPSAPESAGTDDINARKYAQDAERNKNSAKGWAVGPSASESAGTDTINARQFAKDAENNKDAAKGWAVGPSAPESAGTDAVNARKYAQDAGDKAQDAATSEDNAKKWAVGTSATGTPSDTNNSNYFARMAESWAQGGTGLRSDEDKNSAAYWAEQAKKAAGGGVSTFNGRDGFVEPESGDYTAAQVTYSNTNSELKSTNVQDALDEIYENAKKANTKTWGHLLNTFVSWGEIYQPA